MLHLSSKFEKEVLCIYDILVKFVIWYFTISTQKSGSLSSAILLSHFFLARAVLRKRGFVTSTSVWLMTSWSYEIRVYFCTKVRVTSIGPWQHGAHSIAKLTVIFNLIQDICLANFNECIVVFSKESFNPIKVFAWQAFFSRLKIDIGSSKNYLLQRRWRNVLVVNIDKIYAQTYVQNWWYQYCCCFPSEERNYSKCANSHIIIGPPLTITQLLVVGNQYWEHNIWH